MANNANNLFVQVKGINLAMKDLGWLSTGDFP